MKKQTPMKRMSDVLQNLEAILYPNFDFSQKNKKAGSPIPYDIRKKFNLEYDATTGGIPYDTMYFFRDVKTPFIKASGKYMPQPGKSIALGFEYNHVDEPVVTASTVIVDFNHNKTVKASLPLGVAEMRSRLKAFVEEMKYHKNAEIDAILVLFERMVIVTTVEESLHGQEEIAKLQEIIKVQKQALARYHVELDEVSKSLATAEMQAKKEMNNYVSESGIDERISKLEKELKLLREERVAKFVEIREKHNLNSLKLKKESNKGKIFKIRRKIKDVVETEVESMPIAIKQAVTSHFENK